MLIGALKLLPKKTLKISILLAQAKDRFDAVRKMFCNLLEKHHLYPFQESSV